MIFRIFARYRRLCWILHFWIKCKGYFKSLKSQSVLDSCPFVGAESRIYPSEKRLGCENLLRLLKPEMTPANWRCTVLLRAVTVNYWIIIEKFPNKNMFMHEFKWKCHKATLLGLGRTPFPSIKNGNCNTSRLQTCYAVLLSAIDLWESVL